MNNWEKMEDKIAGYGVENSTWVLDTPAWIFLDLSSWSFLSIACIRSTSK